MCIYRENFNKKRLSMKSSQKQKELCSFIMSQASFWSNTNDIDSPTHISDIEEEINNIEWLSDYDRIDLMDKVQDLYFFIRNHGRE
jgi:hypothetical protein